MANGPLIPGLREFDRPKRGRPAWVWLVIAGLGVLVLGLVLLGYAGGRGPLGAWGRTTTELSLLSYRPTATPEVIQVGVAIPPSGTCPDDRIDLHTVERPDAVEVGASVTRSRRATCTASVADDVQWVDVTLRDPLGSRQVVRSSDGRVLTRDVTGR